MLPCFFRAPPSVPLLMVTSTVYHSGPAILAHWMIITYRHDPCNIPLRAHLQDPSPSAKGLGHGSEEETPTYSIYCQVGQAENRIWISWIRTE